MRVHICVTLFTSFKAAVVAFVMSAAAVRDLEDLVEECPADSVCVCVCQIKLQPVLIVMLLII